MKTDKYPRRTFIRQGSLATALISFNITGWAGKLLAPAGDSRRTLPDLPAGTDSGEKIRGSLYERGAATTYLKSRNELSYIGMPVGGINAGGLYLGGDGRLWLWDIFNLNQEGINPVDIPWKESLQGEMRKIRSRDGASYVFPPKSDDVRPLEQGFAVKLEYENKSIVKQLREDDWDEVSFEASYPVATITYTSKNIPVQVVMQAYSPFIPLDADRSGMPVTVFNIEIRNTHNQAVKATVAGWLENKAAIHTAAINRLGRKNVVFNDSLSTGVYSIVETSAFGNRKPEKSFDYGTLCIAAIGTNAKATAHIERIDNNNLFDAKSLDEAVAAAQQQLIGNVTTALLAEPGKRVSASYAISWHSPNLVIGDGKVLPETDSGRYYDNQFKNAKEVAAYVAANFKVLSDSTMLWKNTWYDSTLPHWFLERTFLNVGNLASTTSHRFKSGRYWAWEGVGACQGNCTHVWQYAQATGRLFPAMERDNRERVDLGISLQADGGIWFRGEYDKRPAIDGQAGRVLGCYREHQVSADYSFLQRNWEKIKRATQFIINQDKNKDGMEDTPLENTLDAVWGGEIAWIVGLCIAAVKAGQAMAEEMNDTVFAAACKDYVQKGSKNMSEQLFNGEYFIHKPGPRGRQEVGSYNTCHIDQVFGQSWAFQVGLGRVIDERQTLSALKALWKYNFIKDMGVYAETHKDGRPYALYGESGLVMNTNPKNEPKPFGENAAWQMGYFNECMTGFEHQAASHMMAEGMTDEAMAITKAIHDRYHAAKRNPFNEIECSDHYGRALASYGTFITACGFEYHGPKGYIRFSPKWNKDNFRAPFTAAEGWGSYTQTKADKSQLHVFEVKYGSLTIKTISVDKLTGEKVNTVAVLLNGKHMPHKFREDKRGVVIEIMNGATIKSNEKLEVKIG